MVSFYRLFPVLLMLTVHLPEIFGQQLAASVAIEPNTVGPAETAAIIVQVTDGDGLPVNSAIVTMTAGGGLFSETGKNSTRGSTGSDGMFRAEWSWDDYAASYHLVVGVKKEDKSLEFREQINIRFPGEPEKAPLSLTAELLPEEAAPGDSVSVRIIARREGKPVAGVPLKIGAGGGRFLNARNTQQANLATGTTDEEGALLVFWRCDNCAGSYNFTVLAEPEDEPSLTIQMPLKIKMEGVKIPRETPSAISGGITGCKPCEDYQVTAYRKDDRKDRHSVRVSQDCRFQLTLLPGLYSVELELPGKKKKRNKKEALLIQKYEMNVNPYRETKVEFNCQ